MKINPGLANTATCLLAEARRVSDADWRSGDLERYPTDDATLRWKEAMFHVKHKHNPSVRLTGGKREGLLNGS